MTRRDVRLLSLGALACAAVYAAGLALGQRLFDRSVIDPR